MRSTLLLALFAIFVAACSINVCPQLPEERALTYVGESECAKCHAKVANSFKTHKHNDAFTNLNKNKRYLKLKKEGQEGSCLKCHTTGYGEPGGFVSVEKTPELAMVGCEACHGPGAEHAAIDKNDKENKKRTIQRKPDCGKCHLIHAYEK